MSYIETSTISYIISVLCKIFPHTELSIYNAMFGVYRTGPCYKWTVLVYTNLF